MRAKHLPCVLDHRRPKHHVPLVRNTMQQSSQVETRRHEGMSSRCGQMNETTCQALGAPALEQSSAFRSSARRLPAHCGSAGRGLGSSESLLLVVAAHAAAAIAGDIFCLPTIFRSRPHHPMALLLVTIVATTARSIYIFSKKPS